MKGLVHRAAGWHSAQALYSNRTARTLQNNVPRRRGSQNQVSWRFFLLMLVGVVALLTTFILNWSFFSLEKETSKAVVEKKLVTRIAFGSSTAHDYGPQPVWVNGVIPSDPDIWIWLGDMAYMDEARVNCDALPGHAQCNCSGDWLRQPPHFCMAGNLEHATSRMQAQLANPDYAQFLAFMCPGHRAKGLYPPTGSDPEVCPRSILGTYDDHDYSWKHGNKRLPQKDELKQVFLDAIGEPHSSPRRSLGRGIEWKYVLNQGSKGHEIDVILLDVRYYRDPLPCYIRRSFCEEVIKAGVSDEQYAWCLDFLEGGEKRTGSCCDKDFHEEWCSQASSKESPHWKEACDPSSPLFARYSVFASNELNDSYHDSGFCEVLGKEQRKWLADTLLQSDAPLKLIVSSSVVLGSTQKQPCSSTSKDASCVCSGDEWDCYKPAKLNLLEIASNATGYVVFLTGDLQYSDIRVLRPGLQTIYGGISLSYPLFQVMSSGLTTSTGMNFSCDDLRRDPSGLRDHGECDFIRGPSFGMIEVEWEEDDPVVRLQIRDGMTSGIKLESKLALGSCLRH